MTATVAEPKATLQGSSVWPRYPSIYEINTWVWLSEMSHRYGRTVDQFSVPSAEWDAIAVFGFDAMGLMGGWDRSPSGIAISNQNKSLLEDFRRTLPDFRAEDNGFHIRLMEAVNRPIFHEGQWTICNRTSWLDNARTRVMTHVVEDFVCFNGTVRQDQV